MLARFWNSTVSNPSGDKLLHLFDVNQFEISAPQCPTLYSPNRNGDVLDIVVHENIRVSNVIVSDILVPDHLPVIFHILDHVKIRNLSDPIEKFTDWDRFQSLASELISPKIEIKTGVEADKAARDFSASIASAYRLSTSKSTLLDLNNDLPGLDRLLKHKQRLRKLWQETRDPACKTAVNWVSKAIRQMTRKKALERWETKIGNAEVTSQAIWPIAKSLLTRDGPRVISGAGRLDSCRGLFNKLQILPFQSQYIFSLLLFVVKNRDYFIANTDIHDINTRYNYDLHLPSTNLSIVQKGVLFSGSKIYNHLPLNIKLLSTDIKEFKLL
jgi:hypothetical protein